MVKEECVKAAKELIDYAIDMETLWDSVTKLEKGRGNVFDTADNVETFIKATHPQTFPGHHSKMVTYLEGIRDYLRKGDVVSAKEAMDDIFADYPKILTDIMSECECGEFLVKENAISHIDDLIKGKSQEIIASETYEGLDGTYHIDILSDRTYRLETPSGIAEGKFDEENYSIEAKYQEPDIRDWINQKGEEVFT